MYLLDTNVISELRRQRPRGAVLDWLGARKDAELFLSAVTIGELQAGVEVSRERDPAKAREIESWIERIGGVYNVLPMDAPAFRCCALLMHRRSSHLLEDAMIAATAKVHNLTVATRNLRDFVSFGVKVINPFETPTSGPRR